MRTTAVAGLVLANANDNLLKKLTSNRSMASVPYGARYRLIDFSLSNLVNAGITNVGIITKENYRSLMDHIGSGYHWDLDRKNGGVHILPPYVTRGARRYSGTVDALNGAQDFIKHCKSEYIVICNSDVLANVDLKAALKAHVAKKADVTVIYNRGSVPLNPSETMHLSLAKNDKVSLIGFDSEGGKNVPFSIGITIIGRDLLQKLINEAAENDLESFNRDVLSPKVKQLKIYGFEHNGYVTFMNGTKEYFKASMDLLNPEIRSQVFNKERPVYTKTRDDMPTRYGTKAQVKNSLIADGCVINGTVKNSILFRGGKVEKGAVIENCILMQETVVGNGACLEYVIADKNASIGEGMVLKGTASKQFVVAKNQTL